MKRQAIAVLAVAALGLLAGCDRTDEAPVGFPECTPVSRPTIAPVRGLIVPPGSHMFRARPTGKKLVLVRGYVDVEPVEVRKFYGSLKGERGYEFFMLEDEVIEAEAFFTDGRWRNYVRARKSCTGRSDLYVLVAPEDYGEAVTIPARSTSPSP